MPTDPTPDPIAAMRAGAPTDHSVAEALDAFTVCLMCAALVADGGKDLHREWHEALTTTTEGSAS